MVTQIRHSETIDQARVRLARKSRELGVTLRIDARGNWFAASVSTPDRQYLVTAVSCQCAGFVNHQRCIHHSATLLALGWIDLDAPDPTAAESPCPACLGTGTIAQHHARWVGGLTRGYRDQWDSAVPCLDCDGTGHRDLEADAEFRCQWEELAA